MKSPYFGQESSELKLADESEDGSAPALRHLEDEFCKLTKFLEEGNTYSQISGDNIAVIKVGHQTLEECSFNESTGDIISKCNGNNGIYHSELSPVQLKHHFSVPLRNCGNSSNSNNHNLQKSIMIEVENCCSSEMDDSSIQKDIQSCEASNSMNINEQTHLKLGSGLDNPPLSRILSNSARSLLPQIVEEEPANLGDNNQYDSSKDLHQYNIQKTCKLIPDTNLSIEPSLSESFPNNEPYRKNIMGSDIRSARAILQGNLKKKISNSDSLVIEPETKSKNCESEQPVQQKQVFNYNYWNEMERRILGYLKGLHVEICSLELLEHRELMKKRQKIQIAKMNGSVSNYGGSLDSSISLNSPSMQRINKLNGENTSQYSFRGISGGSGSLGSKHILKTASQQSLYKSKAPALSSLSHSSFLNRTMNKSTFQKQAFAQSSLSNCQSQSVLKTTAILQINKNIVQPEEIKTPTIPQPALQKHPTITEKSEKTDNNKESEMDFSESHQGEIEQCNQKPKLGPKLEKSQTFCMRNGQSLGGRKCQLILQTVNKSIQSPTEESKTANDMCNSNQSETSRNKPNLLIQSSFIGAGSSRALKSPQSSLLARRKLLSNLGGTNSTLVTMDELSSAKNIDNSQQKQRKGSEILQQNDGDVTQQDNIVMNQDANLKESQDCIFRFEKEIIISKLADVPKEGNQSHFIKNNSLQ